MVRHLTALFLGLGVTCLASSGRAQSDSGFALGLRVGYAIPMGKLGVTQAVGNSPSNGDLHDAIKGMVPLWFDVGYRINPALYAGAFFQYGFAFVNKDKHAECNVGSCSARDVAFGANVHYHILPGAGFEPWIGAGLGYELLTANESTTVTIPTPGLAADESATVKGFQFLILEAGGDFEAAPALAIGPFVNFTLGKYTTWSGTVTTQERVESESGDMQTTGLHEWLTIGVRGQYNL